MSIDLISPSQSASALELTSMESNDPLQLRQRLLSASGMDDLKNHIRHRRKLRGVRKFYESQNEQIESLLKPMEMHTSEAEEAYQNSLLKVRIAVWASIIANICLAGLQVYAAVSSLSLSFFATAADSVFDPMATVMLAYMTAYVHRKSTRLDPVKWPAGGSRLTTIANICYSFLMISVNLIIIVESIRSLAEGKDGSETNGLDIPSIVAVAVALFTKFCLFVYCWSIRSASSQVQILWEDHRNDLPVNAFGILTNAGGGSLRWWIDPMGAIIIAVGVSTTWLITGYYEFQSLIGKSAEPRISQLITYKAMTFDSSITKIDSCRAYSSGPDLIAEVDIVMDAETPLWKAHDVSQALQDQLEVLPGVCRAFVHVDHDVAHKPEHRKTR